MHRVRWIVVVTAVGFVAVGCDDVYGDPVVGASPPRSPVDAAMGGTAGGPSGLDGGGGADATGAAGDGSGGQSGSEGTAAGEICDPCNVRTDCGKVEDYCLVQPETDERYCGTACETTADCPFGYECVGLRNEAETTQCVPFERTCLPPPPTLAEMEAYLFARLNQVRADAGLAPFVMDACLTELAVESVAEFAETGTADTKFERECLEVIPACQCNWQEENWTHYLLEDRTWQEALDEPIDGSLSNQQASFYQNIASTEWTRIGIGFAYTRTRLRSSMTFAP